MKQWAINLGTLDESYPVLANQLSEALFPGSQESWKANLESKAAVFPPLWKDEVRGF